MAIYTIPTSISGVSIPGALVEGPLGALFSKKYDLPHYQYPRDLESATRGHVIQFTIQEVEPLTYDTNKSFLDQAKNFADKAIDGVQKFSEKVQDGTLTTQDLTFAKPKTKNVAVVSLYIPETMNFTYSAEYSEPSLLNAASSVLSKVPLAGTIVKGVTSAVETLGKEAVGLAAQRAGYAINPQQQMLFQGIGFRSYQMAFSFTPYSKAESDAVVEIIKLFKKHAMPKLVTQAAGMFFIPPSMFDVKVLFNGKENTKVNKIAKSVIQNVDVNYVPNGGSWSAHTDGAPVQTILTLNMKEMVLLDRTMIEQGY